MPELSEIDPIELKRRLSKGEKPLILDVREGVGNRDRLDRRHLEHSDG